MEQLLSSAFPALVEQGDGHAVDTLLVVLDV